MNVTIAESITTALPAYAAGSILFFVVVTASLARLKSIGILNFANRNTSKAALAENIFHSIAKLVFTTVLITGLARLVLTPNYPGGVFTPDWPMLFSAVIMLVSQLPSVGVIALLSKSMPGKQKNPNPFTLAAVVLLTIITGGAGQILTAAAASGLPITPVIQIIPKLWLYVFTIGAVLVIGIVGHFVIFKRLAMSKGTSAKLILADACMATFPTVLMILVGALAVSVGLG